MNKVKMTFLGFAILTTLCLMLTGIAIGERSLIGIFLSIVAAVLVTGTGFTVRKKYREKGLM